MSHQVIARKFRPQSFDEVVGQNAIVQTLKNSLKSGKLAHAYLFCGLRGTGKTTLARLLAKALNCQNLKPTMEACDECSSCRDFKEGKTLDFIEIDGASHRGIDDIKSIVDTLGYASINRYKIILIDEVHMLTKEAFNALLKTLEEPPEQVKFIFATTEPHKLLPTILSRCLRFDLARISDQELIAKLAKVSQSLNATVDDGVYELIAERAEGSLRDAESLLERLLSGQEGPLTLHDSYELLGYFSLDFLDKLDLALKHKNLKEAFVLAEQMLSSGKDAKLFFDQFRQHLRHLLCAKLDLIPFIKSYPLKKETLEFYSTTQLSYLIELLTEELKTSSFDRRLDVEALLILLIQSMSRTSLVDIVSELKAIGGTSLPNPQETPKEAPPTSSQAQEIPSLAQANPLETPKEVPPTSSQAQEISSLAPIEKAAEELLETEKLTNPLFYDTLMQFAAVELEGSVKK